MRLRRVHRSSSSLSITAFQSGSCSWTTSRCHLAAFSWAESEVIIAAQRSRGTVGILSLKDGGRSHGSASVGDTLQVDVSWAVSAVESDSRTVSHSRHFRKTFIRHFLSGVVEFCWERLIFWAHDGCRGRTLRRDGTCTSLVHQRLYRGNKNLNKKREKRKSYKSYSKARKIVFSPRIYQLDFSLTSDVSHQTFIKTSKDGKRSFHQQRQQQPK